jgi:hypothetical protein
VAFGNVGVGVPSTQSITLTASGTEPVIVSADSLTGTGFTASGITLPLTIAAGQTATLNLQFEPMTAGAATSNLTITSNATTSPTTVIALSGTGVQLKTAPSWEALAGADTITGYNIYRAMGSSSTYAKLNSAVNVPRPSRTRRSWRDRPTSITSRRWTLPETKAFHRTQQP